MFTENQFVMFHPGSGYPPVKATVTKVHSDTMVDVMVEGGIGQRNSIQVGTGQGTHVEAMAGDSAGVNAPTPWHNPNQPNPDNQNPGPGRTPDNQNPGRYPDSGTPTPGQRPSNQPQPTNPTRSPDRPKPEEHQQDQRNPARGSQSGPAPQPMQRQMPDPHAPAASRPAEKA